MPNLVQTPAPRTLTREQLYIANRDVSLKRFMELTHEGWRSTLAAADSGVGFVPVFAEAVIGDGSRVIDIANSSYSALPYRHRNICKGTTAMLTSFLARTFRSETPITEAVVAEGKEWIYRGWVHGKFGNSLGLYVNECRDERLGYEEVLERYDRYSTVPRAVQEIDLVILSLGVLAFTRPDVFPWVGDALPSGAQPPEGLEPHIERGVSALKRVRSISGFETELQRLLIV